MNTTKCQPIDNLSLLYDNLPSRVIKRNKQFWVNTPNSFYIFNLNGSNEQSFYAHIKATEKVSVMVKDHDVVYDVGEFTQEQYDFIFNRLNNGVED